MEHDRRGQRIVVLGGGGFLGSHVCERLVAEGASVVAVDSWVTGRELNLEGLEGPGTLEVLSGDAAEVAIDSPVGAILHLASPASPPDYLRHPTVTLRAGSVATLHAIDVAEAHGARLLFASTSEVYGDPLVHPQPETYTGNVDPTGPRAVYDEAKRFGEAAVAAAGRGGAGGRGGRPRRSGGRGDPAHLQLRRAADAARRRPHGAGVRGRAARHGLSDDPRRRPADAVGRRRRRHGRRAPPGAGCARARADQHREPRRAPRAGSGGLGRRGARRRADVPFRSRDAG